jgi:hypothetical protein
MRLQNLLFRPSLVIHHWNTGPVLYVNEGTRVSPKFRRLDYFSGSSSRAMFSEAALPYARPFFENSFGVNAYDLDNDGFEDVVTSGSGSTQSAHTMYFFRNTGLGFERVYAGDIQTSRAVGGLSFGDFDGDNKIDILLPRSSDYLYLNKSTGAGGGFVVEVLGSLGQMNQQGRVVRASPIGNPSRVMTRVVDGGAGYHAQSQYQLLIGSSITGAHGVSVIFPSLSLSTSPVTVTFTILPGEFAQVFAPSSAAPFGQVSIRSQRRVSSTQRCVGSVLPALNYFVQ